MEPPDDVGDDDEEEDPFPVFVDGAADEVEPAAFSNACSARASAVCIDESVCSAVSTVRCAAMHAAVPSPAVAGFVVTGTDVDVGVDVDVDVDVALALALALEGGVDPPP